MPRDRFDHVARFAGFKQSRAYAIDCLEGRIVQRDHASARLVHASLRRRALTYWRRGFRRSRRGPTLDWPRLCLNSGCCSSSVTRGDRQVRRQPPSASSRRPLEAPPLFEPLQNLAQPPTSIFPVRLLAPSDPPRRLESLNGTCGDGPEDEHRQNRLTTCKRSRSNSIALSACSESPSGFRDSRQLHPNGLIV